MKTLINSAKVTALFSFVLGTILLALHLYLKQPKLLIIGFYFTLIAIFINSIVLLIILILAIINIRYRYELLKTSGILLLNIPIVVFYIYIVLELTSPRL